MATGDKQPPPTNRLLLMASQQITTLQQQQQQQDSQSPFNRSWQRGRHIINKSTSPPIQFVQQQQKQQQQHRMAGAKQVRGNSYRLMSERGQTTDVGDLLRLTNLKLSDDNEPANCTPVKIDHHHQPQAKMLMDRTEHEHLQQLHNQHQQQTQQAQTHGQRQESHLTVIVNESGGQVNYTEHYFVPTDQHQDQPTYYTNSVETSGGFAQPSVYATSLVEDDLVVFGGEHEEFNIGHHHQHHHPHLHQHNHNHSHHHHQPHSQSQQQAASQEEPPLEFLELDSRPPPESRGFGGAHTQTTTTAEIDTSAHFKLSSCGTYLEPAAPANELSRHHPLVSNSSSSSSNNNNNKTETLSSDVVLPESVIRLNEPELETNHQHHYHSPQDSYSSSHLSSGHKSASSNQNRKLSTRSQQQHQLEPNEFRVCEWENCGNTFDDMQQFVKHLEEKHVNQNPREKNRYFCLWSNCKRNEQEFNARYKLLIHMRVHSGEKPYPCSNEDCKKTFSRLENLKIHQRSHTGEKPYKCSYENCSKSFTNSSDRIKHHKTHKDPRPYCCSQLGCAKRYTDPSSLRKHLRAHKKILGSAGSLPGPNSMVGSQVAAAATDNCNTYQHQHQQLAASYQPTPTIIEASYDPCAMLYESQQQQQQHEQPLAYLSLEETYVSEHSLGYEQQQHQQPAQQTIRRDSSAQQIHHHRQPETEPRYQQQQHQHQNQHNRQSQYLSASVSQTHSQYSRSWCAGTASLPRSSRWPVHGSVTPQVQASGQHSLSSSSLNSNSSRQYSHLSSHHHQQQQQQQQLGYSHQAAGEQQQQHHVERPVDFLRPMIEGQTREQQHQSLMRSLPTQPARHHAFPFRRVGSGVGFGDTFGNSSCSTAQQQLQQGYQQQAAESDEAHWYATTNPNRYEPHG